MPKVSIIVRTKNEERWIGHCLSMIYQQDFKDFEVVLVDNNSTDHTLKIAKRYPVDKFVNIDKFLPGLALNMGIRVSSGEFIVCLSAHCVPKHKNWISTLLKNFENDEKLAGVYGRQLPLSFTDDADKRDLLIVFGQDRRVQYKDYFFHNANSMLRRDIWEKFPFDEVVTNIEDRVWGKQVTESGYHIVYDPDASVFHHHGLHQGNKPKRIRGVVSIIEKLDSDVVFELPESWLPQNTNVSAIIPIQGKIEKGSRAYELLEKTINDLKKSQYLKSIYVLSSEPELIKQFNVKHIGRNEILDIEALGLDDVLKESLKIIEARGDYPDSLMYVNYDYIERPDGLFDALIKDAQYKGYDTVFSGYLDYGHFWLKNADEEYKQTDPSLKGRSERDPVYRALYGQGCMTTSALIREGKFVGGKIGILPIENFKYTQRLRDISLT